MFAKLLKVEYPNLEWFSETSFPKLVTFQSYISTKKNHSPPRRSFGRNSGHLQGTKYLEWSTFSQREKAVREDWQTAYGGYNTQTQIKKMRAQEGSQYKKIEWGICQCHSFAWLLFTYKYINITDDARKQQGLHESIISHLLPEHSVLVAHPKNSSSINVLLLICVALQQFPKRKK